MTTTSDDGRVLILIHPSSSLDDDACGRPGVSRVMTAAKRAGKAKPSASTRETAKAAATATATMTTGTTETTGGEDDDGDGADDDGDDDAGGDAGEGEESREEDEQIGVDAGDERVRGAFVPRDAVVVRNILREMVRARARYSLSLSPRPHNRATRSTDDR
jgi:hypothetical protein